MNRAHIVCAAILALCASAGTAFAFTEPIASPAAFASPALLNVGRASQAKSGDLTLGNMKSSNSIDLGGVARTSWLPAGQSCSWDGWRCDCKSDSSSFASLALTFGVKCAGGRVEDAGLFGLAISSKTKSCGAAAPAPCAQGLYTRNNQDGGTFLESASAGLSSAGKVVATVVLAPIKIAMTVASAGVDVVVGAVKTVIGVVGSVVGGTWNAVRDLGADVSKLAVDPNTNPIELVVGTGAAVVKAAVTIVTTVAKAAVTAVVSVAKTVASAVVKVAKVFCFGWC